MKEHKQMLYFKSSETIPTICDADYHGYILVWDDVTWRTAGYYEAADYPYWMQIPKAPSETDRDA